MKNLKIILAVMLTVCLSGCQSAPTDGSGDSLQNNVLYEESAETSGEQISDEPITSETEETYMEKYNELHTEMPPEEILEKRDGVEYPKFEKYTYYSRTAERDTPVNVLLPAGYFEDKEYPVLYILHGS